MNHYNIYLKYKNMYIHLKGGVSGLDCNKLTKEVLTNTEKEQKKKEVYDYLLKKVFYDPNFKSLTNKDIKQTFNIIDMVYFNGKINKYIKENNINLSFKSSAKLTKTAGICKFKYTGERTCKYSIGISNKILDNLFVKDEKSLKINGLLCYNRLECYINILEHELTHLLILLFCPEEGQEMGGHTETFKKITKNLFGHTEYKHMLLSGDYELVEEKKKEMKLNIEVGDYIISKPINGKIFKGVVTNISNKSVTVLLDSEKAVRLYYEIIDRIEGKKEIVIHSDTNEIKEKLKPNDKVKIKLKGIIQIGSVVSVNPKRVRIKMEDGKEWYVPYNMIITTI
ncbi:SprT-like protein [Fadolivirus algeromassiliense]|jgi:hypothetical protein|uniref:SprT-like protein n=1 Tax=Fadolivirus FV1/VV64 TaxID=3070911 RepID=A0A7D3UWF6_9VIRU|nr:SprT-like protein [Fadolivirus algeromassiliense]QKF94834.1 SprT-like protein [Fadolivirus FV1/VV64]